MESTLHQKIRIVDKRFPSSTVELLKFKCRPSLFKCDGVMLLWKIFFSSCFKLFLYFLSMLFASCLSVRIIGDDTTSCDGLETKSIFYGVRLLLLWVSVLLTEFWSLIMQFCGAVVTGFYFSVVITLSSSKKEEVKRGVRSPVCHL